jgi:hypothetical protein
MRALGFKKNERAMIVLRTPVLLKGKGIGHYTLNPTALWGKQKKSSSERSFYHIEVKMACQEFFASKLKVFPS